ncbi:ABC transporter substrate-binding protein [Pseudoroseomonas globiformis]|uniref:ABC transporter substrate-binding protein n=1 Tax=Teichococcus globiformis TaxID=2307229 RepID=A0ABV7FWN5_9PROT
MTETPLPRPGGNAGARPFGLAQAGRLTRRQGFGLLAAATLLPARRAWAAEPVRIGWLRAPNDLTTGRARGTLENALRAQGIPVQWAGPFPAAAPALEALNAGSIDITAGSSTACITALAANIPLQIFAVQKIAPAGEGILVKYDSPLQSLADLVSRTVAVNRGGTGEYLLMRGLARNGIDPANVRRVYLSPGDSGAAFQKGSVDAWASWDPFITIAKYQYGARVLADGAQIGSDNAVTLMASRRFADSRRAALETVFAAVTADNAWAMTEPAEAGRIWAEAMSLPVEMAGDLGANNAVPTRAVSDAEVARIGQIADWYAQARIVPRRPAVEQAMLRLE